MTGQIRVLLVEDHEIVRDGLKLILQRSDDIVVVGEAADGTSAVRAFERLADAETLDMVITDLGLPDMDGLEVVRRIKARNPEVRVLILSMFDDEDHITGMLEVGADGYVLKQSVGQDLAQAIRTVMSGEIFLSPVIARRMVQQVRRGRERERHTDLLTNREREVLGMLAEGSTSKEVARVLGLRTKTVENHRARILEKMGVSNTAAAIGMAYQEGLFRASSARMA